MEEKDIIEKALTSPALQRIFVGDSRNAYPARYRGRVPRKVVLAKQVKSDLPIFAQSVPGIVAEKDVEYFVWVNSYGAVSAILPNGQTLGLIPSEFDVTEWHDEMPPQITR